MRKNRSARVFGGMMLLSWLTIPFIGRQHIKRYLSSTMFISFLIMIESFIAEKKKWWIFPHPPHPYLTSEAALLLGPFLAGSLWIKKFTYGHFGKYMLLNSLVDTFFVYPFHRIMRRANLFKVGIFKEHHLLGIFLLKAVLMYGYQYFIVEKQKPQRALKKNPIE
ncbi:hypothetical protein ND894_13035 [Priestia megaterium]|uniref:hypothetical protein n=2 Tax=Priestia megaterium TaxID=1404 RepID=UPI002076A631|nr:hypothetical protein [Priestia megaterium]USD17775.1 hypothetical protein ND894_07240 [Priestia megaterium]USD18866.1 hypothetical protein ND894_13035 [Priestia megaterium]